MTNFCSSPPQMNGQMFTSTDSFTDAASALLAPASLRYHPTNEDRTPFIAMYLEKSMVCAIQENIKTIYNRHDGKIIPTCWSTHALEPPSGKLSLRVLGSAHNYAGLQILMLEIGGNDVRKDGVPYHTIWSMDDARAQKLFKDTGYTWPVKDVRAPALLTKNMALHDLFTPVTQMAFPRVLSDIEVEAEQLAQECLETSRRGQSVYGNIFDYMACPVGVKFPNIAYQPIRWIDYSNGHRLALDIVW